MKKIMLSLALCASILFSSSCAMFDVRDPSTGKFDPAKVVRYVEPASYFACKAVLKYGEDDEDKTEKAKIIFAVARGVRALASGEVPDAKKIEDIVNIWTPNKLHWVQFASELSMVYERFYDSVTEKERDRLIFEIIGELAEGCERAAKPYITLQEYENYNFQNVVPFETARAIMRPSAEKVMGVKKVEKIVD
jgi:hypothetical protein